MIDLAVRRGALQERIAQQRRRVAADAWPVARALGVADRAAEGVGWLKSHPAAVFAAVAGLIVVRPKRAWRLARRAFVLWSAWDSLRARLPGRQ